MGAALAGEIAVTDGRVDQSNFHDYPLLRIAATGQRVRTLPLKRHALRPAR